jgi:hypothetical protein
VIRHYTGFRFPTAQDKDALKIWLRTQCVPEAPTDAALCECTSTRLRTLHIELPTGAEMQRTVRAALHGFFQDVHQRVTARISEPVRTALDRLLVVSPGESQSAFEHLKAEPSAPGIKPLQQKTAKLQTLRASGSRQMP